MMISNFIIRVLLIFFWGISSTYANDDYNNYSLSIGLEYKLGTKKGFDIFLGSFQKSNHFNVSPKKIYFSKKEDINHQYSCKSDDPNFCKKFALQVGVVSLIGLSGLIYLIEN